MGIVLVAVVMLTIAQLTIKARLNAHGTVPFDLGGLFRYALELLRDWKLVAGGLALVVSSLCWYAGVSRIPLSQAYALAAITYPLIFLGAVFILHEPLTWQGIAGNLAIVVGILLIAST
jgi:drug/metabolite transporter (DMT)-like permease